MSSIIKIKKRTERNEAGHKLRVEDKPKRTIDERRRRRRRAEEMRRRMDCTGVGRGQEKDGRGGGGLCIRERWMRGEAGGRQEEE